jgi:dipeptidyl aminopeptidase/acylaminoacyl peptidase
MTVYLDSIWILDISTRQIDYLAEGEGAVWFPDGEMLAVYVGPSWSRGTDHREIRIIDLEGNIHRSFDVGEAIPEFDQVSSGDLDSSLVPIEYLSGISMAPNGDRLIFSLATYANREERWESYVVNINDGRINPFLPDDPVRDVSWSPDSINIAYIKGQRIRVGELFISDSNGICKFRLELPPEFSSPTWSLNISKMIFLYDGYIHQWDFNTSLKSTEQGTGCP